MKIKIIKDCFSVSHNRKLKVDEVVDFDKEKSEAIIKAGFAEKVVERKTKERKIKNKTK